MENIAIKKVAICGGGTMGSGIAQVCAAAGYHTILYELNEAVLEKAKASITKSIQALVDKGKLSNDEGNNIPQRIFFTSELKHCVADLVIEAIIEKQEAKEQLFNSLAAINSIDTIFASNTSSLSITAIAQNVQGAQRVAGLHFFNPATFMKLVEVVQGEHTSQNVIDTLVSFTKSLGKTPAVCKDAPGFIVNRVARPFYIEALRLAEEGIDMQAIDSILEGKGFKLGPFKLMDLIGNDVNYAVSCSVWNQLGQPQRLKPSPIQAEKVEKGELGRKAGKGYYEY